MGDVAKYDKLPLPRLLWDKLAILGRVPDYTEDPAHDAARRCRRGAPSGRRPQAFPLTAARRFGTLSPTALWSVRGSE